MKCKIPTSDVLYMPNLLVNGDFKINQRGQESYNFNQNGIYGLDCWQHRQGAYYQALIVTQLPQGGCHIKLGTGSGAGLRQYLDASDFVEGNNYAITVSVDNKKYSVVAKLIAAENENKVINNSMFTLDFYLDKSRSLVIFSLWFIQGNQEHDINYCSVFDGSVLYSHQVEDKATALMRCYQYVFPTTQKRLVGKVGSGHLEGFDFPIRMKNTPLYTVIAFETTGGVDKRSELKSISCTSRGVVYMTLQSPTQQEYQYTILFSCEPLS